MRAAGSLLLCSDRDVSRSPVSSAPTPLAPLFEANCRLNLSEACKTSSPWLCHDLGLRSTFKMLVSREVSCKVRW
jgi:hypothetical protein